ncbi:MAG TPA: autotransporter-associated beta strand repeat-containing protein, partial [Verrucomicrobiae bacterium]
ADFSTVNITANRTITLDAAHTLSGLIFGDAGSPADFNWILTGPNTLTLGAAPQINVTNQALTLALPVAGTAGLTKVGNGTLNILGTNTYTGVSVFSNGVVNFNGASRSFGPGILNVGGISGRAVLNINTSGGVTNNGSYYGIGGIQPDTTDTGVGVVNLLAGTLANGNNNNYTEIGTGGLNGGGTYGCLNLQGGSFVTLGSSGIRTGAGGLGIFNQTGGILNCSRWFAVGSQANGGATANAGGTGVANFLGGTATIASGNRIILNDKSGGVGILNIGSEAGGTATVSSLNGSANAGGIDFMDQGGTAGKAILNFNSGTLIMANSMYRNNSAGFAQLNWNGGLYQANGNNYNLINVNNGFTTVNVYNGGMTIDSQANTLTCPAQLLKPAGNGIYPAGGTIAVTSGGGAGYLGQPLVTITNTGAGSNAMAIANLTAGVVTGVTLTCPGQGYSAGDVLGLVFTGGGATNPASTFLYTLTSGDLVANANGGLTKLGSGTLILNTNNTYNGNTVVSAGTLDIKSDGGLGNGSVTVANGATLTLETGLTNGYLATSANLAVGTTAVINLNFNGTNIINALSLDGGATYVTPGSWGPIGSVAANQDSHLNGSGVFLVLSSPSVAVALGSSLNPSVFGQSVTLTATVTGNSGTPTG